MASDSQVAFKLKGNVAVVLSCQETHQSVQSLGIRDWSRGIEVVDPYFSSVGKDSPFECETRPLTDILFRLSRLSDYAGEPVCRKPNRETTVFGHVRDPTHGAHFLKTFVDSEPRATKHEKRHENSAHRDERLKADTSLSTSGIRAGE
jgi:hypothetical protein